jgi:hypothetical protein
MMRDKDYKADDRAVIAKIVERMTRDDEERLRHEHRKAQDRKAEHIHRSRRPDR